MSGRKVAIGTGVQVMGKVFALGFSLITVGLLTRYLGTEGFGHYTTTIAFLQFFGIIVDFGLAVAIAQLIAAQRSRTNSLISNAFTFRLITAVIFFGIAPFAILLLPYPDIVKQAAFVATWALFFVSLNQIAISLFQRELKMVTPSIAEVLGRAVIAGGMIAVVWLGWDLVAVMVAVMIGNALQFIITFATAQRLAKIRLAFDWPVWKEIFSISWPIGLSIIFNLIYFRADTIILSLFWDQSVVGLYGAPYKVLEVLTTFPYLFMGLMLPLLSASWAAKNTAAFAGQLQRAWDVMLIVTLPMVVGGVVLAEEIIILVAGQQFIAATPILQLLLVATGAIYVSNVFTHAVIALQQQRRMLFGFATVAVVALVGYFWLIPQYSYWAAAGVTLVAELLIFVIAAWVVRGTAHAHLKFNTTWKVAAAVVVMAMVLLIGPQGLLIQLLIGALVYGLMLVVLGVLDRDFVNQLKRPTA